MCGYLFLLACVFVCWPTYIRVRIRRAGGRRGWRVTGAVWCNACWLLQVHFVCQRRHVRPLLLQNPAITHPVKVLAVIPSLLHHLGFLVQSRTRYRSHVGDAIMDNINIIQWTQLIKTTAYDMDFSEINPYRYHFLDSLGLPLTVLCQTMGKFVVLAKFWVTAIVVSRLRTTCHHPPVETQLVKTTVYQIWLIITSP